MAPNMIAAGHTRYQGANVVGGDPRARDVRRVELEVQESVISQNGNDLVVAPGCRVIASAEQIREVEEPKGSLWSERPARVGTPTERHLANNGTDLRGHNS